MKMEEESNGIQVNGMQFSYDMQHPLFLDFNLSISPGSRCLLVGANGSGTLPISYSMKTLINKLVENGATNFELQYD